MWRIALALFLASCSSDPGGVRIDGGGGRACSGRVFFAENFESYAPGAPLDSSWQVSLEGPNVSAAVSQPADGSGANGSQRYLLIINNGMPMPTQHELSAATSPRDLSGCSSARLEVAFIVFSLEVNEMDAAFIEWRASGSDWQLALQAFPGLFAEDLNCRPGNQDTTHCVSWMPLSLDIPAPLLASGFQARFRLRTTTDHNDAIGVDDVAIVSGGP
jgi:hypothetical protein